MTSPREQASVPPASEAAERVLEALSTHPGRASNGALESLATIREQFEAVERERDGWKRTYTEEVSRLDAGLLHLRKRAEKAEARVRAADQYAELQIEMEYAGDDPDPIRLRMLRSVRDSLAATDTKGTP